MNHSVSYKISVDFTPVIQAEGSSSARFREMAGEAKRADLNSISHIAQQIFRAVALQIESLERDSKPLGQPTCSIQINVENPSNLTYLDIYMNQLEALMNRCIGVAMIESIVAVRVQYSPVEMLD